MPLHPGNVGHCLSVFCSSLDWLYLSHPLTPFFVLLSVAALVVLRRCRPFWLPILMAIMTGAWIFLMAQCVFSRALKSGNGHLWRRQ